MKRVVYIYLTFTMAFMTYILLFPNKRRLIERVVIPVEWSGVVVSKNEPLQHRHLRFVIQDFQESKKTISNFTVLQNGKRVNLFDLVNVGDSLRKEVGSTYVRWVLTNGKIDSFTVIE